MFICIVLPLKALWLRCYHFINTLAIGKTHFCIGHANKHTYYRCKNIINDYLLVDPREDSYSCNTKPTRGEKTGDEQCDGDKSRDKDWAKDNKQWSGNNQCNDRSHKGETGENKERSTSGDCSGSFSNLPRLGVILAVPLVLVPANYRILVSVSAHHRIRVPSGDIVMGSSCIRHFALVD